MTDDKNYLSEKQILKTSAQIWSSIEKIHDEEKHQASDADACDICLNSYPTRIAVWAEAQVRVFTRKELRIPFCDKHQQECDYCPDCAKEIRADERNKMAKISLKYPVPPNAEIKRLAKECVKNMREKMPSITVDEEVVCLCRVFWGMGALRQIQGISSDREVATNDAYLKGRANLIKNLTSEAALAAVANVLLSHTARNEKYEDLPNKVIGRPMAYGLKEADCKTYWRERAREHIEAAIKVSESVEAKGDERGECLASVKARQTKVLISSPANSTPVNLPLMKSGMPVGIRKPETQARKKK
jgi:hypothetical protein